MSWRPPIRLSICLIEKQNYACIRPTHTCHEQQKQCQDVDPPLPYKCL